MSQVLLINANPKPASQSFGLSVAESFVDAYRREKPDDEIVTLNLYELDIPEIDLDVLNAWDQLRAGTAFAALTAVQQDKLKRIDAITDQFIRADKYVFVSPLWNFGFPPRLKAYIDAVCIAGKTFKYTAEGPVGLLENKKAVHIQARGGVYSEGPAAEMEFGDRHLRTVLNFLGVSSIETIAVEGMAYAPQEAEAIKERAVGRAVEAAKRFA